MKKKLDNGYVLDYFLIRRDFFFFETELDETSIQWKGDEKSSTCGTLQ